MKRSLFAYMALLTSALLVNTAPVYAKLFMNQISNQEYKFTVTSPRPGWNLGTWKTDSTHGAFIGFYYETESKATILSKGVYNSSVENEYNLAIAEYVPVDQVHHEQHLTPWGYIDAYYWNGQKEGEETLNLRLYVITRDAVTYATRCTCPTDQVAEFEATFNAFLQGLILH